MYAARTTFVPAFGGGASLPSALSGLAGELGFNLGSANALSPDFFAEVLGSRELLKATLLSSFDDPNKPGTQVLLLRILPLGHDTGDVRIEDGVRYLQNHITQRVDRRTGIVTLTFVGSSPTLAAAVTNRMVELLNTFNLERLQSQSRARRRFAAERLTEAELELHQAEAEHLTFLQANRRYADSPLLAFEQNRLARRVQLRQEVFLTLTREVEEARIAEVRDTPLLTIIDPAVAPDRRSFPRRKLIVLLAIVAGVLSALVFVYAREFLGAAEHEAERPYRTFVEALNTALSELRAIVSRKRSPGHHQR